MKAIQMVEKIGMICWARLNKSQKIVLLNEQILKGQ
jgi:hypothetical protein